MKHLRTLLVLVVCQWPVLVFGQPAATASVDDPLKKPGIWNKVLNDPESDYAWAEYMGKGWACMSIEEKDKIKEWKKGVKAKDNAPAKAAAQTAVTKSSAKEVNWAMPTAAQNAEENRKAQEAAEKAMFVNELEKTMTGESESLTQLKGNITTNFWIIDDMLKTEFEALGAAYTTYIAAHPDKKYSKEQWVQEKSIELKKLKRAEFEKMKQAIFTTTK